MGAKLVDYFTCRLSGGFLFGNTERDGSNPGVASTTITLTYFCQINRRFCRRPRIRSYRHFDAKAALAQADAVNRFRMQIIGHELVVTFEVLIADIEKERAIFRVNPLFQDGDGTLMTFQ